MRKVYLGTEEVSDKLRLNDRPVFVPYAEDFEIEYFIVAGGGGAGHIDGVEGGYGGGGGGQIVSGSTMVGVKNNYTIIVGAGGENQGVGPPSSGTDGGDSSAFGVTAYGGMGGAAATVLGGARGVGISGETYGAGGGAAKASTQYGDNTGGTVIGGIGGDALTDGGGGGGSPTGNGQDYNSATGDVGVGSAGLVSSFDGSSVTYSSGGSGGRHIYKTTNPAGWGGPGSGGGGDSRGVFGKKGIVIIKYNSFTPKATGGEIYRIGNTIYHKFSTIGSSIFKPISTT